MPSAAAPTISFTDEELARLRHLRQAFLQRLGARFHGRTTTLDGEMKLRMRPLSARESERAHGE